MSDPKTTGKKSFTYTDYLAWPEDEKWELIDGEAIAKVPGPGTDHQTVASNFHGILWAFLEGKSCRVSPAPIDVLLPGPGERDEDVRTVVQPDLTVVCDQEKIRENGIVGAPDLVVEILSPDSLSLDQVKKLTLYERTGVREYWIIHPEGSLMVFTLQADSRYGRPKTLDRDGTLDSSLFPGLSIELGRVFPKRSRVVRESPGKYQG